jgi:GNAT superfamily N-acetyltransferase
MNIEKEQVWTEWHESENKWHHEMAGGYILGFDIPLKTWGDHFGSEERTVTIGKASLHLTDESWIPDRGDLSLIDHVHMDFNDEMNWNEYTLYEYLEDGLKCIKYGQKNGAFGTVAVLHKIEILPEYRGNGLFPIYLKSIIHSCRRFKTDFVALLPHPFGGTGFNPEEMELGKLKLRRFYSQFGFQEVPLEKGTPYMVLPMKPNQTLSVVKAQ